MLSNLVSTLLGRDGTELVRECRRCGTSVDSAEEGCPHCGPEADLVSYDLA